MIDDNTFADACCRQNTISELYDSLNQPPDETDMVQWGLSEREYYEQIWLAITEESHD